MNKKAGIYAVISSSPLLKSELQGFCPCFFHSLLTLSRLPHHSFSFLVAGSLEQPEAVCMEQSLWVLKCRSKWLSRTSIIKSHKKRYVGCGSSNSRCNMRAVLQTPGCFGNGGGVRRWHGAQRWDVTLLRCDEWQSSEGRRGGL